MTKYFFLALALFSVIRDFVEAIELPLIVSLWENEDYISVASNELKLNNGTALTSVVEGIEWCELNRCNQVGYGWSSDENGESSLDATIFDGASLKSGSVGSIKLIRRAIRTAYYVFVYTYQAILVGREATDFAVQMGLERESLSAPQVIADYENWRTNSCQVNYWKLVTPDPTTNCGPYWKATEEPFRPGKNEFIFSPEDAQVFPREIPSFSTGLPAPGRDSAGLIVIDKDGNVAAGTSTSGRSHRIPGRISDCALPGSACYASNDYGAAITTGNGDVMGRFGSGSAAVLLLELGYSAQEAAQKIIDRINKWYPNINSGIVVVGIDGYIGAACAGFVNFSYSVISGPCNTVRVETISCKKYPFNNA